MGGGSPEKSRLAALVRHGAGADTVTKAREALVARNLRIAVNAQRDALGLPPVGSDLEAVSFTAAILAKGA